MASIAIGGSIWNTTANDKTIAGFVPDYGALLVVIASSSGLAGGTTSVTDSQGGTYVQVDVDRTGFSTTGVLTVWVRTTLITDTRSMTVTAAQTGSSGGGLMVLRARDMYYTGASAVRSTGGQSTGTAGTTPAPVLNLTPLESNPIVTAVSNGTNGYGAAGPATYNANSEGGYNTPATGLAEAWKDSGVTNATITWGGNSATAFASVAIELDATSPTFIGSGRTEFPGIPEEMRRRRPAARALNFAGEVAPVVVRTPRNPAINHQSPGVL